MGTLRSAQGMQRVFCARLVFSASLHPMSCAFMPELPERALRAESAAATVAAAPADELSWLSVGSVGHPLRCPAVGQFVVLVSLRSGESAGGAAGIGGDAAQTKSLRAGEERAKTDADEKSWTETGGMRREEGARP